MLGSIRHRPLLIVVALVLLVGVACAGDPMAQVAKARGEYEVRLTNFLPQWPEPAPPEPTDEEAEGAMVAEGEAEAATDGEEGGDLETEPPPPERISVLFDLVVGFEGTKSLPGLTIELLQQDAAGQEKSRRLHYIETPGIRRGSDQQVAFELEGFLVEDGDSFGVTIPAVDPSQYGDYREFAEAGN